jgi:hypothetical protein
VSPVSEYQAVRSLTINQIARGIDMHLAKLETEHELEFGQLRVR